MVMVQVLPVIMCGENAEIAILFLLLIIFLAKTLFIQNLCRSWCLLCLCQKINLKFGGRGKYKRIDLVHLVPPKLEVKENPLVLQSGDFSEEYLFKENYIG